MLMELEEQKSKVVEVKEAVKMKKVVMGVAGGCCQRFWWEDEGVDLDVLDMQEVKHYLIALEDVRKQVAARLHEMKILNGTLNLLYLYALAEANSNKVPNINIVGGRNKPS
ncbi:hypothetical protein DVH24_033896 [Malus domestica]|uniref:Uncharacterized protein n=1 Tax=Malus domestica TaxID=3750 RepID=A0A498KMA8_MALDO|nr:hypothetical protein DVH24_033896 [Malus domestica]